MKAGWEERRLAEVSQVISTGPFGSVLHKSDYVDQGVPIVNPTNIVDDLIVPDPSKLVSPSTAKRLQAYILHEGDIVVARRGEIGRCAVVGRTEVGWLCGTGCFFIRPMMKMASEFIARMIRSTAYRAKLELSSTGTTMKNLSNSSLSDLMVRFPPLAEQQRIVAILNEAFAAIATAQANAAKNRQNAQALFEKSLSQTFSDVSSAQNLSKLGDLAEVQSGGTPATTEKRYWGGSIPWYSSGELNRLFTTTPERFVTQDGLTYSNAKLFPAGSLLIGMYDTAALKMSILDRDATFNQAIAGVKPNGNVNLEFVMYAITASKESILSERRGVRQKNLSLGKIKSIVLNVPPVDHQNRIVSSIRTLRAETQRLEAIYRRKLAALDELKQSLLHQAFNGDL